MEMKTMDAIRAYLRRRQDLIDQIRHRHRLSAAAATERADRIIADEERDEDEQRQWDRAHWHAPQSGPDWYLDAWHDAYLEYLEDNIHPDWISLKLIEDTIQHRRNTGAHKRRLRLAILASLWRSRQVDEDEDDREPIVNRVVLYEEAVSQGVKLDDVNEALQLMAQERKTRKEQNRLAYIVRRMKGGKVAVS
jgi:hypothetical protein